MGITITIGNYITIAIIAVIMALVATGDVDLKVRTAIGANVVIAARGGKPRAKRNSQASGPVSDVFDVAPLDENPLERALREAGRIQDTSATVIATGAVGVVISHDTPVYQAISGIFSSGLWPQALFVSGRTSRIDQLPYDFAATDIAQCIMNPRSLTLEHIGLDGEYSEYTDVVVSGETVREVAREIEVEAPGYCLNCKKRVYRNDVELVYVPREGYYHSGHDTYVRPGEMRDLDGDPYYIPATIGACQECDGRTLTFGAETTRMVKSSDYEDFYVAPLPAPVPADKPERSNMVYSVGYCMGCKAQVSRTKVRMVTLDNGSKASVGVCPTTGCGRDVYRMGGTVEAAVVRRMDAITALGYAFAYHLPEFVDKRFAFGKRVMDCDFPTCDAFGSHRGHKLQRVPGRPRNLIHTEPAALCDEHHGMVEARYDERLAARAA